MGLAEPLIVGLLHMAFVALDMAVFCVLVFAVTSRLHLTARWIQVLDHACRPIGEVVVDSIRRVIGGRFSDATLAIAACLVLSGLRTALATLVVAWR